MKQRSLALNDVPMVVGGVRREPFDRAGDKIGGYSVDGDAATGDQNSGLASSAKIGIDPGCAQGLLHGKRGIFFASCTIGADG